MTNNEPQTPKQTAITDGQVGVAGDHAHIEGGIHFHTHTTPTGIPLQRPPRAPHFTDRQRELAQLLADLQPGRVVTLCGPGGIGKTALAAEAIWTLAPENEPPERFPDGIIFHTFYGKPDPALALEHIALSYGEEPRPTPVEAALRALSGKQALLILDGTENAYDLRAVLDIRGNCGALVTSRARGDAVAERQDLAPLDADDAINLLRKWGDDQVKDTRAAEQICQLVGRLPLAVRLAGRYLARTGETAAAYLEWLRKTPLEALDHGQRRLDSVPVLLEKSLAQVSEAACDVLAAVGLLALSPFRREPIAAALDLSPNQLRKPLDELVNYGLLLRGGEWYEVSHALIHTYARECCPPPAEVTGRLATYYTTLAETESAKGLEGYARLDTERAHLVRALAGCVERKDWAAVRSMVWAVDDYLDIQGHWTERLQALETGLEAAKALGDRREEGAFLDSLGTAHRSLGQIAQAVGHYEQARDIFRLIDDRESEGVALGNLGNAHYSQGQYEQAVEFYTQALEIAREIGDRQNEGNWVGNLGNVYAALDRMEQAIECWEQAVELSREIGDRRNEGIHQGNLGIAYRRLRQGGQAIEHFTEALKIAREIGDRSSEGNCLGNLGNTYADLGQDEQASEYYEQQLVITREIGDRRGEANVCWNLGAICAESDPVRAVELMSVCVAYEREIGHPDAEAHARLVVQIKAGTSPNE
jgi:tetratricopeptide (TPR) repeat protein